jgi:hypothetical protein
MVSVTDSGGLTIEREVTVRARATPEVSVPDPISAGNGRTPDMLQPTTPPGMVPKSAVNEDKTHVNREAGESSGRSSDEEAPHAAATQVGDGQRNVIPTILETEGTRLGTVDLETQLNDPTSLALALGQVDLAEINQLSDEIEDASRQVDELVNELRGRSARFDEVFSAIEDVRDHDAIEPQAGSSDTTDQKAASFTTMTWALLRSIAGLPPRPAASGPESERSEKSERRDEKRGQSPNRRR